MYETWDRRTALKRAAGVDLRGRDNKAPVLHYTLSWEPGQTPSERDMMEAARQTLERLKLTEHQAVIACHNDTAHPHIHVIVNTVHPTTGRTADLKFTGIELTKWAREYERLHEAQKQRDDSREQTSTRPPKAQKTERDAAMQSLEPDRVWRLLNPKPHALPHHRRRAIEKADIVNRMRRHRAEHDHRHMVERDVLWSVHRQQRGEVYRNGKAAAAVAIQYVRDQFKGQWTELYKAQHKESKIVDSILRNPLERAVFVISQSRRLGRGKPLTAKETAKLIQSPTKLVEAVHRVHTSERRDLSNAEGRQRKERLARVWASFRNSLDNLATQQNAEREAFKASQTTERDANINFYAVDAEIRAERRGDIPRRVAAGASPLEDDLSYVARKRREMDVFYERNRRRKDSDTVNKTDTPNELPIHRKSRDDDFDMTD